MFILAKKKEEKEESLLSIFKLDKMFFIIIRELIRKQSEGDTFYEIHGALIFQFPNLGVGHDDPNKFQSFQKKCLYKKDSSNID
jgi:hypothetical protein